MEEEIDLIDMFKYFWKKKILILLVGIICVILSVVYTEFLLKPKYNAVSTFVLTNNDVEKEADVYFNSQLPDKYLAVVESRTVLDKVIVNLKLNMKVKELKKCIEITNKPTNFLISVSVTRESAKEAAVIANEIVKVAIEEINRIYQDKNVQILDVAIEDNMPINVDLIMNILVFVVVGEVLVCGYIMIRYMFVENSNKKEVEDANKE